MKKISFNFFTAGNCIKIIGDDVMIHVVLYYDDSEHKQKYEVRLPGGTIRFEDIINGIKKVQARINLSDENLAYLEELIEDAALDFETKTAQMSTKTNSGRKEIRNLFVSALEYIADAVEALPKISERHLDIIQDAAKKETLCRELRTECGITTFSSAAECGYVMRGEHFQFPFLVLDSDAPDEYRGSADKDIERSYNTMLESLDTGGIYPPHRVFLTNTLNLFLQIFERDPSVSKIAIQKIKDFLKEAN